MSTAFFGDAARQAHGSRLLLGWPSVVDPRDAQHHVLVQCVGCSV